MRHYLALDCETGGIGADKSLLTAFFLVLNKDFEPLDELLLQTKPNDDIYHITAESLGINKISLIEHDKVAITEKAAGSLLYNFLKLHSEDGKNKLLPLGHNVAFDIKFLQAHLMSQGTWEKFVSYRTRDTGVLGHGLMDADKIPFSIKGSLTSWCEYFKIDIGKAHTADADVKATIEVYKRMLEVLKK